MTSKDLHMSIIDSNYTVGRRYIGRCSQVYRGKKAIHVACAETYTKAGKITNQFIEKLIEHGADVNVLDEDGRSPLLLACRFQIDPGPVVEFLKSQNADFNIVDKDGNGVIHLLAENKRIENKESLTKAVEVISRVISPEMFNSRNNQGLTSANLFVHHPVGSQAAAGLIALVENGFDFRSKDKFGKTLEELVPMCQALNCRQVDEVQSIIWTKKDYDEKKEDSANIEKEGAKEVQENQDSDDPADEIICPKRNILIDETPVDMSRSTVEQFEDEIPSRRSTFNDSGCSNDGDFEEDQEEVYSIEEDSSEDLIEVVEEELNQIKKPIDIQPAVITEDEISKPNVPEPELVHQTIFHEIEVPPKRTWNPQPCVPNLEEPKERLVERKQDPVKCQPLISDLQKAIEGACGRMDDENRITSGPLQSKETLKKWIYSIRFQGEILDTLHSEDLFHPRDWLGGNQCSVMKWLKSPRGRKVVMVDRQIIKSSCTKYKKIFGVDISKIKFEE